MIVGIIMIIELSDIRDVSLFRGGLEERGFGVLWFMVFGQKSFMVYGFGQNALWFMVFQNSLKFYGLWF